MRSDHYVTCSFFSVRHGSPLLSGIALFVVVFQFEPLTW